MKNLLILYFIFQIQTYSGFGQSPNWGGIIQLDNSVAVIAGKMKIENLEAGFGIIEISKVIKGDVKLKSVKVQFSDRRKRERNTKQEEEPTYYYENNQTGIWVLVAQNNLYRYELRNTNLYYELKWEPWVVNKLELLNARKWTESNKGISGSVLVDSMGVNKWYRFFYLCLRNDTKASIFINTHYRIQEQESKNISATIITPKGQQIDMVNFNSTDCRLAGEPGWPTPMPSDFVELLPGKKMYLLANSEMRCFYQYPENGIFKFISSYTNSILPERIKNVWTGTINFPETNFYYVNFPEINLDPIEVIDTMKKTKPVEIIKLKDNELMAKYYKLIQEADTNFSKKKFKRAQKLYEEVLSLRPDEKYPAKRIEEINQMKRKSN